MPFSSVETKKIVEIDFGLFNPDDIVSFFFFYCHIINIEQTFSSNDIKNEHS